MNTKSTIGHAPLHKSFLVVASHPKEGTSGGCGCRLSPHTWTILILRAVVPSLKPFLKRRGRVFMYLRDQGVDGHDFNTPAADLKHHRFLPMLEYS